jgi:sulfopyruvate decarboxylase subunit alpha
MSLLDLTMATLKEAGVTHLVVTANGENAALQVACREDPAIEVVDTCREGEAVAIATGLVLGGARPCLTMENFGFFECLDTLRALPCDVRAGIPIFIGYTGRLGEGVPEALEGALGNIASQVVIAGEWTEAVLEATGIGFSLLEEGDDEGSAKSALAGALDADQPYALLVETI